MKTFKKHLEEKLTDKEFKEIYDEERILLEISLQLQEVRKVSGLSQRELAKIARVTQQQLSKIESGLNCNLSTFLRVCHALKVKLDIHPLPSMSIKAADRHMNIFPG